MSNLIKTVESKARSKKLICVQELDTDSDNSEAQLKTTVRKLFLSKGMQNMTKKSGYIKTVLTSISTLTMNGSGAYLSYVTMDPSGQSEWSSYAALFDEFRILTAHLHFIPVYNGSSTAGSVVVAYDNDSLVTPGSQTDVITYQNHKASALYKSPKYSCKRPNVTSRAYWVDVATPSGSVGSFPYTIGYSSASTAVCQLLITYDVEFRGRR